MQRSPGHLFICACICILGLYAPLKAQVTVERSTTTDSVDIFAAQHTDKSHLRAGISSLILPGAGHHYLEKRTKALTFLGVDALCIGALYYFKTYTDAVYDDSKAYARRVADASHTEPGASYWRNVAQFMDSEEYNRAVELSRQVNNMEKYTAGGMDWKWPLEAQKEEYADMRARASKLKVVYSFFIASLAINRMAALIDVRNIFRQGSIAVTPDASSLHDPANMSAGISLTYSF